MIKTENKRAKLSLLGFASGIAAGDAGCGDGPEVLQTSNLLTELQSKGLNAEWLKTFYPGTQKNKLNIVTELCYQLAEHTKTLCQQQQRFAVMGGDHSSAIGTWSGIVSALKNKPLGLVWIDAHMDSHTLETTPSGNIHGMPVAALLGYGPKELTNLLDARTKLKPEHVSLVGIRSFEAGEAALLHRLGVRIYDMNEIKARGMNVVLQEAIEHACKGTAGYGLSIDLDGVDPKDAPGVGTPAPNGIRAKELCDALTITNKDQRFLGVEVVEFNPHHDRERRTQKLIQDILLAIFKNRT